MFNISSPRGSAALILSLSLSLSVLLTHDHLHTGPGSATNVGVEEHSSNARRAGDVHGDPSSARFCRWPSQIVIWTRTTITKDSGAGATRARAGAGMLMMITANRCG